MTSTPTLMLSDNFSLAEAVSSQIAPRLGIDNTSPNSKVLETAQKTAAKLEKVRYLLGQPIHINSWIRCLELNRALRSSDSSQHVKGEAVDFICPMYGTSADICKLIVSNKILVNFDQLILEHTWVHISWNSIPGSQQRGQVLSLLSSGTYSQGLTNTSGKPI
jgi:hypothetical protein